MDKYLLIFSYRSRYTTLEFRLDGTQINGEHLFLSRPSEILKYLNLPFRLIYSPQYSALSSSSLSVSWFQLLRRVRFLLLLVNQNAAGSSWTSPLTEGHVCGRLVSSGATTAWHKHLSSNGKDHILKAVWGFHLLFRKQTYMYASVEYRNKPWKLK